ncbi:hypothetical protein Taro_007521, partial [Colocasia esculenta]|nr:hypothetical protein [Colocasia esculenta]
LGRAHVSFSASPAPLRHLEEAALFCPPGSACPRRRMEPSQTRRVVLLVDLQPLLALHDPAAYSASVLAAARRLLSFPALSSSLFACKPFFSSLSPLLSTSAIHRLLGKSAAFLSFDRPSCTLDSLARTLASLSFAPAAPGDGFAERLGPSRASLTAESLFQLAYDCTWEPSAEVAAGMDGIFSVRPNLVVMFSHVPQSSKCLSEFLDLGAGDELLSNVDEICAKFVRTFSSVSALFIARDVHFSWLDVSVESSHLSGDALNTRIIEKGIKGLGWGFCSTDAIALGSVLIPFGLIYPYVGCQLSSGSIDKFGRGRAELSLEISDVSGKPLECKICDLDMFVLSLQRENTDICEIFSQDFGGDIAKILVKKVWNINEQPKVESKVYASLQLRGFPREFRQDQRTEDSGGSFHGKTEGHLPDVVLKMFSGKKGEVIAGKPAWQLLLAFLYRRSLCAFVSVSSSNGNSLLSILRPFTVHSAVMYLMDSSWTDGGMLTLDAGSNTCASAVSKDIKRLVNLAIYYFSAKYGVNRREDTVSEEGASCDVMVASEIAKLLLKKPKDVAAKYKSSNGPSLPSNSAIHNEVNKVREHELQMLFRLEILQSKVCSSIEENLRLKMVKDICLLLENIEFDLQGGMFAGESLIEFAGRTIKARYEHSLEDIVHRIYTAMEFFSFDGVDGGDSASLPNSNSEPQRDEEEDAICKDVAGTSGNPFCQNTTAVGNSSHAQEINENRVQRSMEHAENNVLMTAQERREKARRFSHFTSWRQNLQRVWAPKQAKVDKPILDSFHRSSHKRRRHLSRKDMVCETPMMRPKDPAVQQDDDREERKIRLGNASLSKALFHSEYDP